MPDHEPNADGPDDPAHGDEESTRGADRAVHTTDETTRGAAASDAGAADSADSAADAPDSTDAASDAHSDAGASERLLPADVVDEAERLTRLARRASDPAEAAAYREERAALLAEHDCAALLRAVSGGPAGGAGSASSRSARDRERAERAPGGESADPGASRGASDEQSASETVEEDEVLVVHPEEWLVDGDVDPAQIDDVERAVEVPLDGSDDPDDWDAVHEENHAVAEAVRAAHGDRHGDNAAAYAEYVSNHYAKPLAAVTAAELELFREEYYPRNVWPTDDQAAVLDRSLELVYDELSVPLPEE